MRVTVRFPRHLTQGIRNLEMELAAEVDKSLHSEVKDSGFDVLDVTTTCAKGDQRAQPHLIDQQNQKLEIVAEMSIKRRPKFYLWIVGVPNFLCCIIGFGAFLIDWSDYVSRLQHIGSLMLVVGTVRFTINLPHAHHLTLLDKWFLSLFFVLILIATESSAMYSALAFLEPSDKVFECIFAFAMLIATMVTSAMACLGYGGLKTWSFIFLIAVCGWLLASLVLASDNTLICRKLTSYRTAVVTSMDCMVPWFE
jgi:hypothetical protein